MNKKQNNKVNTNNTVTVSSEEWESFSSTLKSLRKTKFKEYQMFVDVITAAVNSYLDPVDGLNQGDWFEKFDDMRQLFQNLQTDLMYERVCY